MSLWQTKSWQEMLLSSGQTQEYFIIELDVAASPLAGQNGERCCVEKKLTKTQIFVEKRKVSFGQYGLFVIGFDGIMDEHLTEHLQDLCKQENCLFAQIETLDYSLQSAPFSLGGKVGIGRDLGGNGMRAHGDLWRIGQYYKKFIPPYTAVIELSQSEEHILAAMKPKGRYNIKFAQKNGITVQKVEKTTENIKIFYDIMMETTSRGNFSGNTLKFYETFAQKLSNVHLYFAFHEDDVISAGFFIFEAETVYYYYGASSDTKRNLCASYLLQWTLVQEAQKYGALRYDFLGIASPGDAHSSLIGVTDFKLKFTADTREVSQSFLYVAKPFRYTMIQLGKKVRKK